MEFAYPEDAPMSLISFLLMTTFYFVKPVVKNAISSQNFSPNIKWPLES